MSRLVSAKGLGEAFLFLVVCGVVLKVCSSSGAKKDPEAERRDTCEAWALQAHELSRDLRYSKVTPWEARGKANEIADAFARNRCDDFKRKPEPVAETVPATAPAKATTKPKAKPKDPRCEGLDPEVCEALAAKDAK